MNTSYINWLNTKQIGLGHGFSGWQPGFGRRQARPLVIMSAQQEKKKKKEEEEEEKRRGGGEEEEEEQEEEEENACFNYTIENMCKLSVKTKFHFQTPTVFFFFFFCFFFFCFFLKTLKFNCRIAFPYYSGPPPPPHLLSPSAPPPARPRSPTPRTRPFTQLGQRCAQPVINTNLINSHPFVSSFPGRTPPPPSPSPLPPHVHHYKWS